MTNAISREWARRVALATLAVGLSLAAGGASARSADETEAAQLPAFEQVDSFSVLTPLHSWQALDDRNVIVWATPFRPYLVELAFPSPDLKFSQVIGVTSVGSRVYSRFDSVHVAGFRYPIENIYKLTREEARNLARES